MFGSSRLLRLHFFIVLFDVSRILGGEPAVRPAAAADVIERFTITKDSCWIPLPVEIQGKRYQFNLDTGATVTFYDKSLWHLLGKAVMVEKIGPKKESVTAPFFYPPDARLGKLRLPQDYWALGVELREHHEESGEEIHGILGMDFLKEHIFRMDFDRGEVVFLRSVGPDPGQRLDIRLTKNKPQVKVDLPGLKEPEWFVLELVRRDMGECMAEAFAKLSLKPSSRAGS